MEQNICNVAKPLKKKKKNTVFDFVTCEWVDSLINHCVALVLDPQPTVRNGWVILGNKPNTTGGRPQRQFGFSPWHLDAACCHIKTRGIQGRNQQTHITEIWIIKNPAMHKEKDTPRKFDWWETRAGGGWWGKKSALPLTAVVQWMIRVV